MGNSTVAATGACGPVNNSLFAVFLSHLGYVLPASGHENLMEPLLLVEDKPELRAMLRKALERAGHAVDEAPDGSSAVAKVRARRYMLVLTDLKLPGCSGLDVLRETKLADPTIPVILITAYGSVEEAVTAMKEGAYDFIQKPVDLEHLNLLVERASQQQELHRENLLLREEYTETLRISAHRRRAQDHAGSNAPGPTRGGY